MKPTDAQNSSFIGIMTLRVSDSLSAHHQEFLVVYRHWYIFADLMTVCYQEQDGCSSILVANDHQICKNVQLRSPDDGQKGCPKYVESKYQ